MSWTAGSRAVCIRILPWRDDLGNIVDGPTKDVIYLVNEVVVFRRDRVGLVIAGFHGLWDADEFRRVVPVSERVEASQEVAA